MRGEGWGRGVGVEVRGGERDEAKKKGARGADDKWGRQMRTTGCVLGEEGQGGI